MACNGNCGACSTPCSAAKFLEKMTQQKAENEKEECKKKMSESTVKISGCGAPSEPDHIRANAAIIALQKENEELKQQLRTAGASTPLCFGIKNTTCLAVLLAAIALGVALYALLVVGKYSAMIEYTSKSSTEALSIANKALASAENAEKRADKNYIYLRGVKQDLRGE